MKIWKESQDEVNKIRPDKEMAKSLLKMMEIRLKATESLNKEKFTSIVVEGYYEVIKEGITALMAIDGYKTLSHEVLIAYLKEFYREFTEYEIQFIDQLRQLRNKIVYKGFFVQTDYLERNERQIKQAIEKFNKIIQKKLR
jgi:hypothetical protein